MRRSWSLRCVLEMMAMVVVMVGLLLPASAWAVVPDCNGNAIVDGQDIESGRSVDCNGNGVPDECDVAPLPFDTPVTIPLGDVVVEFVAADFDDDGLVDLVAFVGGAEATLAVLLQRDHREFEETVVPTQHRPSRLTTGDVDGNGAVDVIGLATTGVLVLLNRGDGSFEAPVGLELPSPSEIAAGDVDGDGVDDLAVSSSSAATLTVIFGDVGRVFDERVEYETTGTGSLVAVGDVDADGNLDVASMNRLSGDVSILHNGGDGVLAPGLELPGKSDYPRAFAIADLDGDGLAEVTVMSLLSLAFFHNRGRSFGDPVFFTVGDSLRSLHLDGLGIGDIDGDDDVDLLLGTGNADTMVSVLNAGDGTFNASLRLNFRDVLRRLAVVDLDTDGAPDAVGIMSGELTVVFNEGVASRSPVPLSPATVKIIDDAHATSLADLDGDGDLDLAVNDGQSRVMIVSNEGNGTYVWRNEVVWLRGSFAIIANTSGDLDGDGIVDLVVVDERGNVFVLLRDQDQYQQTRYQVRGKFWDVTTADLDADGDRDILGANRDSNSVSLLFNDGDGMFPEIRAIAVGSTPLAVAAGNVDSDGHVDVAVASSGSSQVAVLFGDGRGNFPDRVEFDVTDARVVTVADVDGDGDLDLAAGAPAGVLIFANDGNRGFRRWTALGAGLMTNSLIAVDLDGDGRNDLVGSTGRGARFTVILNRGNDAFSAPFLYAVEEDPRFVLHGDIDGDGDADLVVPNHSSQSITALTNHLSSPRARAFVERICTVADFFEVAVAGLAGGDIAWLTKYVAPADPADADLLPVLFQNVRRHDLHQEFLAAEFPDRFALLTNEVYDGLVGRRATRQYFVGVIHVLRTSSGPVYGFNVLASFADDPGELPTLQEVRGVYESLRAVFDPEPLAYFPDPLARADAATWRDPGFPIHLEETSTGTIFQPYTTGTGVGRVRILGREEFQEVNSSGRISFQDILILAEAPRDIEGVVGGVVTAAPQVVLSHMAVRLARRGTPNAYLDDALAVFEPLAGKLIRLIVGEEGLRTEEVTPEEAVAWWDAARPEPSTLPDIDTEYSAIDDFHQMDLSGDAVSPEARYGGKATNLARLQRILDGPFEEYIEVGLAVPMRYYLDFLRSNTMPSALEPTHQVTYEEFLAELEDWPEFRSDPELRFKVLDDLRDHMRDEGQIDPELVSRLATRIEAVFGWTDRRVRFRSSSNVEDILEFNGAGLYDSTSSCVADDLDDDVNGPSLCDASRPGERGIERALKRVWRSLWNYRAYEERAFFGLPQGLSAMGILLSRAFPDERVNGVALTGNPVSARDRRYLVTAQMGEVSVVSPDPGVVAEVDFLRVEAGQVVDIDRARASSLAPPGGFVLSNGELEELGAFLWHIDQRFPVETGDYPRQDVLLDVEFKFEPDGSLAVKQVRPFLRGTPSLPTPSFELVIPAAAMVCGVFVQSRTPEVAYELKSTLRLAAGTLCLRTETDRFSAKLIEEVRVGPDREVLEPRGDGTFRLSTSLDGEVTTYRFRYRQDFAFADGTPYEITLSSLAFRARGEQPLETTLVLDEEYITRDLVMEGLRHRVVRYSSCRDETMPLWDIRVELEDGSRVRLLERHEPPPTINDTGPGSLVHASLDLPGIRRSVSGYWNLVYTALRHNQGVRHWVVLDPPAVLPGLSRAVKVVEVVAPEPGLGFREEVNYLDEDFELIESRPASSYTRERILDPGAVRFRRGDVRVDGVLGLDDAVALLWQLFGREIPVACGKAADTNDDGRVNTTDAVAILRHLFLGSGPLPEPSGDCGVDPTDDELACPAHDACMDA